MKGLGSIPGIMPKKKKRKKKGLSKPEGAWSTQTRSVCREAPEQSEQSRGEEWKLHNPASAQRAQAEAEQRGPSPGSPKATWGSPPSLSSLSLPDPFLPDILLCHPLGPQWLPGAWWLLCSCPRPSFLSSPWRKIPASNMALCIPHTHLPGNLDVGSFYHSQSHTPSGRGDSPTC